MGDDDVVEHDALFVGCCQITAVCGCDAGVVGVGTLTSHPAIYLIQAISSTAFSFVLSLLYFSADYSLRIHVVLPNCKIVLMLLVA